MKRGWLRRGWLSTEHRAQSAGLSKWSTSALLSPPSSSSSSPSTLERLLCLRRYWILDRSTRPASCTNLLHQTIEWLVRSTSEQNGTFVHFHEVRYGGTVALPPSKPRQVSGTLQDSECIIQHVCLVLGDFEDPLGWSHEHDEASRQREKSTTE